MISDVSLYIKLSPQKGTGSLNNGFILIRELFLLTIFYKNLRR